MTTAADLINQMKENIRTNENVARDAANINITYKFVLSGDGGGTWIMKFKRNPEITEGDGAADCTISMSASDYIDMIEQRAVGHVLYCKGKLQTDSAVRAIGLGPKLQKLTNP